MPVATRARAAVLSSSLILPRFDLARHVALSHALEAATEHALLVDIRQLDVIARERADMGDAVAHLTGADHADLLMHRLTPSRRCAYRERLSVQCTWAVLASPGSSGPAKRSAMRWVPCETSEVGA